jgi:hypothetical protein
MVARGVCDAFVWGREREREREKGGLCLGAERAFEKWRGVEDGKKKG